MIHSQDAGNMTGFIISVTREQGSIRHITPPPNLYCLLAVNLVYNLYVYTTESVL